MGEPTSSSKEAGSWVYLGNGQYGKLVVPGADLLLPVGTISSRVLVGDRVDLAGVPDADASRYLDAVGVKAFKVVPLKAASTSVKAIAFAYSTEQSLAPVNATLVAYAAAMQAVTGGTDYDNTGALVAQFQGAINTANAGTGQLWAGDDGWVKWDGVNRIKTIVVGSVGGTHQHGILLQLVR